MRQFYSVVSGRKLLRGRFTDTNLNAPFMKSINKKKHQGV